MLFGQKAYRHRTGLSSSASIQRRVRSEIGITNTSWAPITHRCVFDSFSKSSRTSNSIGGTQSMICQSRDKVGGWCTVNSRRAGKNGAPCRGHQRRPELIYGGWERVTYAIHPKTIVWRNYLQLQCCDVHKNVCAQEMARSSDQYFWTPRAVATVALRCAFDLRKMKI